VDLVECTCFPSSTACIMFDADAMADGKCEERPGLGPGDP
jgi:hypothetical protein